MRLTKTVSKYNISVLLSEAKKERIKNPYSRGNEIFLIKKTLLFQEKLCPLQSNLIHKHHVR